METSERARDRKRMVYQVVVSGFLVLAGIYLIGVARALPGPSFPGALGPKALPLGAFSILVIANLWLLGTGLAWLARERREAMGAGESKPAPGRASQPEWLKIGGVLASLFVYAWIWHRAGFLVTSFLFVTGISAFLTPDEKRSWLRSILLGLMVTGAIYGLFYGLLQLPLPYWDWR